MAESLPPLPATLPFSIPVLILLGGAALVALFLLAFALSTRFRLRVGLALAGRRLPTYRIRVHGADRVPASGPALVVCNRLHFHDWVLLCLGLRRPVRCLLVAGWVDQPWAARLARWAGAITVGSRASPRDLVRAVRAARQALARGELVCLFAQTRQNAAGMLPFARLYRQVSRGGTVPVIPVNVDQPRGSLYWEEQGTVVYKKPDFRPHPVEVRFGAPLPAGKPAAEVRQALQELSAEAALGRGPDMVPPHRQFVRNASRHPFRTCLFDSSTKGPMLSYGKVLAGAMCLARHLKPTLGDAAMVAVWLPPGAGGALSNIALALLGKTSVNLNYTSSPEAVRSALRQCQVRHVLTARRFLARVPFEAGDGVELVHLDELLPKITSGEKLRAFLKVLLLPTFVLERWVLGLHRHRGDDLATIIFSSGSTGEPKGVMLTHRNVAANVELMLQATGFDANDRALGVLPFFHSFGYTVTLWVPLAAGASAVYHADPRQSKEIGDLCRQHRCTIFLNTATFLRFCLRKCEPDHFRSVRILICGAEKLPPALAAEFAERFGVLPLEGYGCTELTPATAANMADTSWNGCTHINNKSGSIGPPLPGVSGRVVEPETLEPLPPGHDGLLVVRGANVMKGYLGRPDLTAQAMLGGDYITGDMARIDEDGHITLTGRLSRFAKVGGEMVPLEKVEEELHLVLGTNERVLAVSAVPDERRGEKLVVLHLPLEVEARSLARGLAERGLPNLWIPGDRDFFLVDQIPVLGSGKLDLKRVKEMALERAPGGPLRVAT